MNHELKTWPAPFNAVYKGSKNFEIRKDDRDFKVGDILELKEFDPETGKYSGVEIKCLVDYILQGGQFGLEEGYVAMAITPYRFY